MKTIGIFGGTFDPIHIGHLNFAQEVLEKRNFDQIWFIPTYVSPFKVDEKGTDPNHRLNMVKLAIDDAPQFKVSDVEVKREKPSYSIDTIKELIATHKDTSFRLLISDEIAKDFFKWREPEKIIRLAPLIVGTRNVIGDQIPSFEGPEAIIKSIKEGWTPVRRMGVTATEVRERLRSGRYCGHLVPQKVLDYIYKNRLYSGT